MRTRYLPPGSMRRQRLIGRIEGAAVTGVLIVLLGLGLLFAEPTELSAGVRETAVPAQSLRVELGPRIALPPCTDPGAKDCMADPGGPTRHVPEPSSLALILAAFLSALRDSAAAAATVVIQTIGRRLGMSEDDE